MIQYDTETLRDYDRKYVWHPFTQMRDWEADTPIVITRGEGSFLVDTEGNRYLDGVASVWTNVHGHCRPEINRAVKEAEEQGVVGKASTPFLLARVAELTGGDSLKSNIQLVFNNAILACEIAKEYQQVA